MGFYSAERLVVQKVVQKVLHLAHCLVDEKALHLVVQKAAPMVH